MDTKNLKIPSTVSLEHILHFWEQNDILILIVDLNDYDTLNTDHLDDIEKEHLEILQTEYFKKRYITSRIVLKHILCSILKERTVSDISMYKDKYGKVHVHNHKEVHICISYTENIVTLAISKTEIGVDVELRKLRSLTNVSKYLHNPLLHADTYANGHDHLMIWTLKEAYCKFLNKSILSNLNKELYLDNICHLNYIINSKYILAVVTD
ncbi:4'-phosphopantetheinyl transferase family protein [Methanococcoides alaskense]|uniref:4'-phosphopantetheinyl transferase n=1 Tax=Methanococcoides alaskense TaxID=325778 RepID=A0AA90Z757_9EURY|nr:hypothetical protein [Methanococcoides alaskense]MDA0524638.1 hypothetical protein [Methanococcoides alaskense]MDR6222440.1 4'-phosphopantetheinyl transferase [Methanococcoides alaskense]